MIKSVFAKYILAFLAIITTSFVILAAVISSVIVQHSIEAKRESMDIAARLAGQNIETRFAGSSSESFAEFINPAKNSFASELSAYTEIAGDSLILVTDLNGNILVFTPSSSNLSDKNYISGEIIQEVLNNRELQQNQTLNGVFTARHFVSVQIINSKNGEPAGILFLCSASVTENNSVTQIINIIILSCIWVLVAAMVLLYFITDKIIAPVREMNKAAKSFTLGRFDVRIPTTSNKDEIGELASAFNKMAASLAVNEETQRTFLSNVAHDLRTPMASIGGFVDSILNGVIPVDKDVKYNHEYYLKIVSAEIRRLARLVESLLYISKIQAGENKFSKTNFDICEKARLVLISLEQKINAKNLDIEFRCGDENNNENEEDSENKKIFVYADSDAVHQILYNLLENAIKFSPEKGLIKIIINDDDKEKARISVYNTGEGIPSEDIPFVFDRTFKSDRSRGLDKTGFGLGLFIVKTIIDAHGEKIQVTSEYEKYCEFIFTLKKYK